MEESPLADELDSPNDVEEELSIAELEKSSELDELIESAVLD